MSYDPLPTDQSKEKPASSFTKDMHEKVLHSLPFDDRRSFENAAKGFIATLDPITIKRADGSTVLDLSKFDFLKNLDILMKMGPSGVASSLEAPYESREGQPSPPSTSSQHNFFRHSRSNCSLATLLCSS